MPDTTVAYHVEDGVGRPAINVKVHCAGRDYWPPALEAAYGDLSGEDTIGGRAVTLAYERVVSDFWQAAQEIATQRGLGEITQEGRSGGWLAFTECDPNVPEHWKEAGEITEWLAGYRSMVEWADAFITDAPRKVRDLAASMAMDEAGEPAARRFFAFDHLPSRADRWSWA